MQRKAPGKRLSVLAAWIAFFAVAFGAAGPAQAQWCGPGWQAITSYQGPASGTFSDMWMIVCITKATTGEYFAGTITVYNGATSQGQYNGNYGSRYVQFGTTGGKAMLGRYMGANNTTKTIKGYFGNPTNDCFRGELKPGQQVTCASAWVFDNSPNSANSIAGYVYVGGWFWQAGMNQWQWATGAQVRESSLLN